MESSDIHYPRRAKMTRAMKARLAIFLTLCIAHAAIYEFVPYVHVRPLAAIFGFIYVITLTPAVVFGDLFGLRVLDILIPTPLGLALSAAFWAGLYWLLAYLIVRWRLGKKA